MSDREEYVVKQDEAAIVIRPSGEVECLMPNGDVSTDDTISHDSPTFKAMVIMMFLRNEELRQQVSNSLVEEYFREV